jgi:hypothetical protein
MKHIADLNADQAEAIAEKGKHDGDHEKGIGKRSKCFNTR